MLLSTIFDQLAYGELAKLVVRGEGTTGITPQHYPAVVSHVNLGLTALHKSFPLKLGEALIRQYEEISIYYLSSKYAINSGSVEPIKYIIDTVNQPFIDNILKIEDIYDENGERFPLNDPTKESSLYTPSYNSIQITNPIDLSVVSVVYRADHSTISVDGLDPTKVEVDIPHTLLEPLLFYVASRMYASVPSLDGYNESAAYLGRYEKSIQRVQDLGLIIRDERSSEKFEANRWV